MLIKNAKLILPDTVRDGAVLIKNGRIERVITEGNLPQAEHVYDASGAYLAPGFVDVHIHGTGGHGTEDMTAQSLLDMSLTLAGLGVTSFFPTLYPGSKAEMIKNLKGIVGAFGKEQGAKLRGLHLEGPFISPEKPGVMKPQDISPVDIDFMSELVEAGEGKIKIMTFAPEVDGADKLIDFAAKHGIFLQAGHTNATYEQMMAARAKGISHVTHLFNAMSPFTHRAPGAAGAAMMEDFSVEIIADGVHVHPAVVSFLGRIKKPEQIVLVTDALKPTEQHGGPMLANREAVKLDGGVFKRLTDNVIAGSALTMLHGIKNLVSYGFPLENAILAAASNPAKILGVKDCGVVMAGMAADITLFDASFNLQKVFIDGKILS
ncbi:N-acetylglucosamine-6-phosphate deacetylase [Elusimicrobium simillimum]|uniref:N-acetylglucosamine-6-phosphate deacetylase n=1 Tax=Elusimicrobium simillimum TaxID=3143438 RepID=UPI003C6EDE15